MEINLDNTNKKSKYEMNKKSIKKYFSSEEGHKKLLEAKKRYRDNAKNKEKIDTYRKSYYVKYNLFKNEFKRLSNIQLEFFI
jgi:hypothetical protein